MNESLKNRQVWDQALLNTKEQIERNISYLLANSTLDIYLRHIPVEEGQRILEPGAGSGLDTLLCAKKYGIIPYLLDFSESSREMVKHFQKKLGVEGHFVLGDCRSLKFSDNYFDVVWNNGVNEHFAGEDRQKVFDEMARVCKKGGYVLVAVPNTWNPLYRIKKRFLESRNAWPFGFEQPFSPIELKRRMKSSGLKIIASDGFGLVSSLFDFFRLMKTTLFKSEKREMVKTSANNNQSLEGTKDIFLTKIFRKTNRATFINKYLGNVIIAVGKKEK